MRHDWEHFKSHRTDLIVFPGLIAAVSRQESAEAMAHGVVGIATHAATAAFGPVGLLARLVFEVDEIARENDKTPTLDRITFRELLGLTEPTQLLQGQVPNELLDSGRWPYVEWHRPVYVFPRGYVREIRVKWTSTVTWQTPEHGKWTTEINFWRTARLRSVLTEWAYPLVA
jgi:hypothetical protein